MGFGILEKCKRLKLWYRKVLKEKNEYKLPLKDKLLAIKYGFSSDFYHMYGLNKNNIDNYISEYHRMLSREINGEYKIIMDNKILFNIFFGKYVNVPKILCIILDKFYSFDGKIINDNEVIDIIKKEKVIIKPAGGTGGGKGVHLIEYIDNTFSIDYKKNINEKQLIDFLKEHNNYIINSYINQHEYASKIYDKSTNTIRIITLKDPETGNFIIPIAVHRFGNSISGIVDNASSGGCVTWIDVETGIMEDTKQHSNTMSREKHPDTEAQIKGVKIPNWQNIKNELIDIASKMPYIPFIAWDVVITGDEEFSVIEVNASCGLDLLQLFEPAKGTKIGEFYKYYGIIK